MEVEIASCLADIKQAINEINEFLPDKKNFFEFQKDKKTLILPLGVATPNRPNFLS